MAARVAEIGSFEHDVQSGRGWWSQQMFELLGREPGDRVPSFEEALASFPPEDAAQMRGIAERVIRDDEPARLRHAFYRGRELRQAETRVEPLRANGAIVGIRGTLQDITVQANAEEETARANRYVYAITEGMAEGLYTLDGHGRVTYVNQAAADLLGWSREALAGEVMHELIHHHRPDGSRYEIGASPISQVLCGGGVARVEEDTFIRRDGSQLEVAYTASPYETADALGAVVVFRDISARKESERRARRELEQMALIGRIREAMESGRMVPYAQPIVELGSERVVEHELLVRMLDEEGEVVPPGKFLPAAEEHGVIVEIDKLMLREATAAARQGHRVTLNLSAQSIADGAMIDAFRSEIALAGIDPGMIVVELTETALLHDEGAAIRFVERLDEIGCGFALDDFGTGYGGFSYLKQLPVDYLKIDIEFVRDLRTSDASRRVVEAVVALARGFGQRTIAEGVEDAETLELLTEMSVDLAQGYHLGRPAPLAALLAGSATGARG